VLIKCDESQDDVVCHLVGDLEHLAVGQFHEAVAQLGRKQHVIFELSGVPFVDSGGLGALMRTIRRTHQIGGEAVVCAASPAVRKWLQLVALPRSVNIFDSLPAAQAYFRAVPDGIVARGRAA
jgi:anti-anti-sigma factor